MSQFELYGARRCPYTQEMREWLEWRGLQFVEHDVENDRSALRRMKSLPGAQNMVPILVENGLVVQIGWQGRGCVVEGA